MASALHLLIRYLNITLQNNSEPFGFLVFSGDQLQRLFYVKLWLTRDHNTFKLKHLELSSLL
jgi:hypothetical protein